MIRIVNGSAIHYEIRNHGNAAETPVLLLHGWGCDMSIFAGVMSALQDDTTLIALDFPAHGESAEPPEPWGVGDFALQVKQLLHECRIDRVNVIAHSFGARVAIYLASHEPQLIGKLVITGGAGVKKPSARKEQGKTLWYKRFTRIVRALAKVPLLKQPMLQVQEKLVRRFGSADYVKLNAAMRATFVKIISEDLTPMLSGITAPTLLIWGDNDQETPLWMGQTMEREIRDCGLVVFQGRSHYAFLEESARFHLIIRQFFQGGDKR